MEINNQQLKKAFKIGAQFAKYYFSILVIVWVLISPLALFLPVLHNFDLNSFLHLTHHLAVTVYWVFFRKISQILEVILDQSNQQLNHSLFKIASFLYINAAIDFFNFLVGMEIKSNPNLKSALEELPSFVGEGVYLFIKFIKLNPGTYGFTSLLLAILAHYLSRKGSS